MRFTLYAALPWTLLLSSPLHAVSFDCKLAHTPREKAVCADSQLSAQDSTLAATYKRFLSQLSPESVALLRADQREWISYLDQACPLHGKGNRSDIRSCLKHEYTDRLADFKAPKHLADGHILYSRVAFAALPNKGDSNASYDPGFGTGRFAYPQVDRPNSAEAAWNSAVTQAALTAVANDAHPHPTTFTQGADSDSEVDLTWSLDASNARLLAVEFEAMTMPYGAAHPGTTDTTFSWWLDRSRELQASDVFIGNAWKTKLIQPIVKKLRADADRGPLLWNGAELSKGVSDGLASPGNWTLTSRGLTIAYGQYQVAAYAAGMPFASFTWSELAPFTDSNLKPETLPASLRAK